MKGRADLQRNSDLIVIFGIDEGHQSSEIFSGLPLFAFEKIGEFDHAEHLAGVIGKASENNTFVFEDVPIIIILFPAHTSELSLFLTLDIIV